MPTSSAGQVKDKVSAIERQLLNQMVPAKKAAVPTRAVPKPAVPIEMIQPVSIAAVPIETVPPPTATPRLEQSQDAKEAANSSAAVPIPTTKKAGVPVQATPSVAVPTETAPLAPIVAAPVNPIHTGFGLHVRLSCGRVGQSASDPTERRIQSDPRAAPANLPRRARRSQSRARLCRFRRPRDGARSATGLGPCRHRRRAARARETCSLRQRRV